MGARCPASLASAGQSGLRRQAEAFLGSHFYGATTVIQRSGKTQDIRLKVSILGNQYAPEALFFLCNER